MFKSIDSKQIGQNLIKMGQNLKNGFYFIFINDIIIHSCFLYDEIEGHYTRLLGKLMLAEKEAQKNRKMQKASRKPKVTLIHS